jgi:XTP/dITP diphosphohydrolase
VKILIASTNPGKLRDFRSAAAIFDVELETLPGLTEIAAPPEDEETFEGNARVKAEYYSRFAPGELVLADDSGLEVDALFGAPGVRSARYAEDLIASGEFPAVQFAATTVDERNNLCLLRAMENETDRKARYRCALALACDGIVIHVSDGSVDGEILRKQRGNDGFGYDPLFCLPQLNLTMAEVALEEKQRLSHRGRALNSLLIAIRAK